MTGDVIETPHHVRLVGKRGGVVNESYGPTGLKLMGQLWAVMCDGSVANCGINHWVYLPGDEMFTGVELVDPVDVAGLETLEVTIPRYLRAIHTGPYSELPGFWASLKSHLAQIGETPGGMGMEIYGHWCENPAELETTILIGLKSRA